jgi:hypothetical protein
VPSLSFRFAHATSALRSAIALPGAMPRPH